MEVRLTLYVVWMLVICSSCLQAQDALTVTSPTSFETFETGGGLILLGIGIELEASGGSGNYTWSLSGQPPGLDVVTVGSTSYLAGVIEGYVATPTVFPIEFHVEDALDPSKSGSRIVNMTVNPPLQVEVPQGVPDAIVGLEYGPITFSASGGVPPYKTIYDTIGGAVISLPLPPGMTLTKVAPDTWEIGGVPTAEGAGKTYTPVIGVTDKWVAASTADPDFEILTIEALVPTFNSIHSVHIGEAYDFALDSVGGLGEAQWQVNGLPPWLSLKEDNQEWSIRGFPPTTLVPGTVFPIEIVLSDPMSNPPQVKTYPFDLVVQKPIMLVTTVLPTALVDEPYLGELELEGGVGPWAWEVEGLPPGLHVVQDGSSTIQIEGSPSGYVLPIPYTLDIFVSDSDFPVVEQLLTFDLHVSTGLALPSSVLPTAQVDVEYAYQMVATLGTAPYFWTAKGLPDGITFNTKGEIGGVAPGEALGSHVVDFTVTDSSVPPLYLHVKRAFVVSLDTLPFEIITDTLPVAKAGQTYQNYNLYVQGVAIDAEVVWSGVGLPPGIELSVDGVLSGEVSQYAGGTYPTQVLAMDVSEQQGTSRIFSFLVQSSPSQGGGDESLSATSPDLAPILLGEAPSVVGCSLRSSGRYSFLFCLFVMMYGFLWLRSRALLLSKAQE